MDYAEMMWVVGFMETAGNFSFHGRCLSVRVNSTEKELLDKLQRTTNIGNVTGPYAQKRRQPVWSWRAKGESARLLMSVIAPYLCSQRRRQIEELLDSKSESV